MATRILRPTAILLNLPTPLRPSKSHPIPLYRTWTMNPRKLRSNKPLWVTPRHVNRLYTLTLSHVPPAGPTAIRHPMIIVQILVPQCQDAPPAKARIPASVLTTVKKHAPLLPRSASTVAVHQPLPNIPQESKPSEPRLVGRQERLGILRRKRCRRPPTQSQT